VILPWQDPPEYCIKVNIESNVPARMRDGMILFADVYRPAADGPWPVLLMRTPYDKSQAQNISFAHPVWYARHGFMVVVQDCRGRWKSEGEWYPLKHEELDGYDTINWAAQLPGSSGYVAMYGFSYAGAVQLLAAAKNPKPLVAIIPAFTPADYYDGCFYRGGAFQQAFAMTWSAYLAQDTAQKQGDYQLEQDIIIALHNVWPHYWAGPQKNSLVRNDNIISYYYDWIKHDVYDDYWIQWSIRSRYERINVPGLHITGWYDIFLEGTLENFCELDKRSQSNIDSNKHKLVIGPWYHMPWQQKVGNMDCGNEARNCVDALQILWLNNILRKNKNQIETEPRISYFVMGMDRWRHTDSWPPVGVQPVIYYLRSGGRANSLNGDGKLDQKGSGNDPSDIYTYDPRNPAMSLGGRSGCINGVTPMGVYDQTPQEFKNGMLVYTSEILTGDLLVIGNVEVVLFAATSAEDTDFVARLTDVFPDGRSQNIVDGIIRSRFRNSISCPMPVGAGEVCQYNICLGATAYLFKAGHRVRLDITSSNFPAYDRNSNSGKLLSQITPALWQVATQIIFHNTMYPSRISLPIVPD